MNPKSLNGMISLCTKSPQLLAFFKEALANGSTDRETRVDDLQKILGLDRHDAINLAKEIDSTGFGRYIIGRRNNHTRLEWNPTLMDVSREVEEAISLADRDVAVSHGENGSLTIMEAKQRLSETLGVPIDRIDITIHG